MTSPADEPEQDAIAAEGEAPVAGDEGAGDAGEGGDDQDDLAAEWDTMVGEEEGGDGDAEGVDDSGARESTRVLNQDEIDSLLGFDEEHEGDSDSSAINVSPNVGDTFLEFNLAEKLDATVVVVIVGARC